MDSDEIPAVVDETVSRKHPFLSGLAGRLAFFLGSEDSSAAELGKRQHFLVRWLRAVAASVKIQTRPGLKEFAEHLNEATDSGQGLSQDQLCHYLQATLGEGWLAMMPGLFCGAVSNGHLRLARTVQSSWKLHPQEGAGVGGGASAAGGALVSICAGARSAGASGCAVGAAAGVGAPPGAASDFDGGSGSGPSSSADV